MNVLEVEEQDTSELIADFEVVDAAFEDEVEAGHRPVGIVEQ